MTTVLVDYLAAREILGNDFISPEDVAIFRPGIQYIDDQILDMSKRLPDRETLVWIRDNGMMLVAGPPTAMTMLEVRGLCADFFYSKGPDQDDSDWYDDASEKFAKTDKVEALGWIAFRKEPVQDSLSKDWSEQQALVIEPMTIPNAAEATWALTTYKAVRDVYLLEDLYVRTSSVDSGGNRVGVGGFDADGLDVNDYWDDYLYSSLGVSESQKFRISNA